MHDLALASVSCKSHPICDFKAGDKLIISKSLVTEVLYEDYYLSSSTTYDFTDDATIEGTFHMPPYRLTGSFLAPTE
ncbi:MAG: hypothetical protein MUQ84_11685, partial [Loktanella sp.]|nr:hypothetical protein [Loktanella sp.]